MIFERDLAFLWYFSRGVLDVFQDLWLSLGCLKTGVLVQNPPNWQLQKGMAESHPLHRVLEY